MKSPKQHELDFHFSYFTFYLNTLESKNENKAEKVKLKKPYSINTIDTIDKSNVKTNFS